jgi:hypothetical protein
MKTRINLFLALFSISTPVIVVSQEQSVIGIGSQVRVVVRGSGEQWQYGIVGSINSTKGCAVVAFNSLLQSSTTRFVFFSEITSMDVRLPRRSVLTNQQTRVSKEAENWISIPLDSLLSYEARCIRPIVSGSLIMKP